MIVDDGQNGHTHAALASLRTYDVSRRHTGRLRRRCHDLLQPQVTPETSVSVRNGALRRIIAPALGGAWCLAYLGEIMRRAAAVYFGTP